MRDHPEAPPPNEDCLFLNVFTPTLRNSTAATTTATAAVADGAVAAGAGDLLPVLVWIHGGGMCIGAASEAWGTAWDIIKEQNVLLVNFNYRLVCCCCGCCGCCCSCCSCRSCCCCCCRSFCCYWCLLLLLLFGGRESEWASRRCMSGREAIVETRDSRGHTRKEPSLILHSRTH
jgi:hypothetical protein